MPLYVNNQEIYIVGYSLRLPDSNTPHEFHQNLFNKVNMVHRDEHHFSSAALHQAAYLGKLKQSPDYFDHLFFGIHGKQAEKLDPQLRILLETSFEALVDGAIGIDEIKGSSMGVYTGICFSDAHNLWLRDQQLMSGYEHSGCAGTMFANRLSYFYDLHGPSFSVDTACSSSLTALNYAFNDLQQGKCDTALVSGSSLILRSAITQGFQKLQMLSPDGFCKTFDTLANGYSRADGIITLLLTRRPDFIRYTPHAKIMAASSNTCGYHPSSISYPNHQRQVELYREILDKTDVPPSDIKYIECHGTGTVVGDTEELLGIKQVFGDREDLTLGALKSNMGHAEGASGLASVAKVLLSYENQVLYPQLHLQERIPLLGQLHTLTEPAPWDEAGYALINSFGFGGSNACVLMNSVSKEKKKIKKSWHGLQFISARTKEGLYPLKRELEKSPQQLPVFKDPRYSWREVIGLSDDPLLEPVQTRPLYFVFSGNGSQWRGMGIELMKASSLFKKVLLKCGKDVPTLLVNGWSGPLQDTRLLVAIQIGLIELLKSLGIRADGFLGHSAGEIAASYASGATSIEETMAIASARGRAAEEMPDGLMISVGLSQEEASDYLLNADKVCIACINSPRNLTLSGDREQIKAIQQRLLSEEKFVRELNTQGKPYHSLLIDRNSVIKHVSLAYQGQSRRNTAWLSAIKDYQPDSFSAEYHIESVTRPVDFLGAMQHVPTNAIMVEIGPHSILRSLVRDCASSVKYISLMTKDVNDFDAFREGLGLLWKLGVDLPIAPDNVRPSLSVRALQTAWKRDYFPIPSEDEKTYKHTMVFDLQGKDAYLLGHAIDHRPLFPAMGMAYVFWQCYLREHPNSDIVTLDNFSIHRGIPLIVEQITLEVVTNASGTYQLLFHGELIAEAVLGEKECVPSSASQSISRMIEATTADMVLPKDTFYRLCRNRGYHYTDEFQVLDEATVPDDQGFLYAKAQFNHWISFLDGLLHITLLRELTPGVLIPTFVRHMELSQNKSDEIAYHLYTKSIYCGDILLQGGEFTVLPIAKNEEHPVIFQKESHLIFGNNPTTTNSSGDAEYLSKVLSVIRQNAPHYRIQLCGIGASTEDFLKQAASYLSPRDIISCLEGGSDKPHLPNLEVESFHFDLKKSISDEVRDRLAHADLVVVSLSWFTLEHLKDQLSQLYQLMKPGAFFFFYDNKITDDVDQSVNDLTTESDFGAMIPLEHWTSLFNDLNFKLISYQTDPNNISSGFLIRKSLNEMFTMIAGPEVFFDEGWANHLRSIPDAAILYSNEPGGMAGFARTLSMEGQRVVSFCAPNPEPYIDQVTSLGLVTNVIHDNKPATLCYTSQPAAVVMPLSDNQPFHLEFGEPGNLDKFSFIKSKRYPGAQCKVEYAALNFRDVMLASGKINKQSFLGFLKQGTGVGFEFSGYQDNKRVMGIALDAIANLVHTDFFWEIPEDMELAEAATIPVAYLTVYYSFFERARLHKKHKILIHGGAGAVGQAAIRVATALGCEVFTTCQESKREYLKALFPKLDDAHIGDSRSTQFEQQVKEATKGKGVDMILNSLADDKLQASLYCLAQHGTFIEIGKYDLMCNTPIGLRHFLPNTTFCGIDVDQIFTHPQVMKRLSVRLLKGMKKGVVQPIDKTLFKWTEMSEAFRYLGSGNHRGKVVLDMSELTPARIENRFYTSGAHLIVGGLGGFGMAVAEWLAERGAVRLILCSRSGITTGEQKLFIQQLKMKYVHLKIDIAKVDLIHPKRAEAFIKKCPPLTGIYNLAMVINDTLFNAMTKEKWQDTVNCKVLITHNLDQLTREHPIKHFVCFSSVAVHGNPGQANYAFANNYMESICYERRAAGLAGMAIQWGAIADVGFVAKQNTAYQELLLANLGGLLSINTCLTYLESCLLQNNIVNLVLQNNIPNKDNEGKKDEDVLQKISRVLKIDLASIPDDSTLIALGLDSLQAAEMHTIISYANKDMVSIAELGKMTIGELKEKFAKEDRVNVLVNDSSSKESKEEIEETNQIHMLFKQHGEELNAYE